ncbi:Hypothetical predicted protein [Paramuricea clavata]|uniref:Uncharacterized protein n=1 Tax=Paramuricea clavata TaxID=317549 RepID=A0A7D9DHR0_PARCT|nr:Hypothetical predicted protein [Paramuricea clavata]
MAKELKIITPIQNTISSFVGKEWGIIASQLPELTNPEQLFRFAGKDPTNCFFKSYLQLLRDRLDGNQIVQIPSSNTFSTESRHQGIICRCEDPLAVEQSMCGRKDTGFALAMYTICGINGNENLGLPLEKVFKLVERVNFATRQTYNVIVVGTVEDIVSAKGWIAINRGSIAEIGYISRSNVKSSGDLRMIESIDSSFMVYHAAVGDRLSPEHVNFTKEKCPSNLVEVPDTHVNKQYSLLKRLIEMFSRQDDWILDINSAQATGVVAALKSKRNGLCLVSSDDEEFMCKRKLSELMRDK